MTREVFVLYALTYAREFAGLLSPTKVTTMLLRGKDGDDWRNMYKLDESNVKKMYIPKLSKGKFGESSFPTLLDHVFYAFMTILYLPYILLHKKIVFIFPPFYTSIIIPILVLFDKKIYLIAKDSEQQAAKAFKQTLARKIFYKIMRRLEIISIKLADRTYTVSKEIMNDYKQFTNKVSHMPTGADVKVISRINPKRISDKFTITYVGGIEKWRGLDMLIEATKRMNVKVFIIGSGPDKKRLLGLAHKNVMFSSHLQHEDAMAYCKGSDLLVLCNRNIPASTTTSSIKVFEYIACEIPCLVTDSGEHVGWVHKTRGGIVVDDTVVSIRKGIEVIMKDKRLYNKCIKNAKKNKGMIDYKQFKKEFIKELRR